MLSQQKFEKTVHFLEHQYILNQCIFFDEMILSLDTQKPEPNFFDNFYVFHNGGHLHEKNR